MFPFQMCMLPIPQTLMHPQTIKTIKTVTAFERHLNWMMASNSKVSLLFRSEDTVFWVSRRNFKLVLAWPALHFALVHFKRASSQRWQRHFLDPVHTWLFLWWRAWTCACRQHGEPCSWVLGFHCRVTAVFNAVLAHCLHVIDIQYWFLVLSCMRRDFLRLSDSQCTFLGWIPDI